MIADACRPESTERRAGVLFTPLSRCINALRQGDRASLGRHIQVVEKTWRVALLAAIREPGLLVV